MAQPGKKGRAQQKLVNPLQEWHEVAKTLQHVVVVDDKRDACQKSVNEIHIVRSKHTKWLDEREQVQRRLQGFPPQQCYQHMVQAWRTRAPTIVDLSRKKELWMKLKFAYLPHTFVKRRSNTEIVRDTMFEAQNVARERKQQLEDQAALDADVRKDGGSVRDAQVSCDCGCERAAGLRWMDFACLSLGWSCKLEAFYISWFYRQWRTLTQWSRRPKRVNRPQSVLEWQLRQHESRCTDTCTQWCTLLGRCLTWRVCLRKAQANSCLN